MCLVECRVKQAIYGPFNVAVVYINAYKFGYAWIVKVPC